MKTISNFLIHWSMLLVVITGIIGICIYDLCKTVLNTVFDAAMEAE